MNIDDLSPTGIQIITTLGEGIPATPATIARVSGLPIGDTMLECGSLRFHGWIADTARGYVITDAAASALIGI